MLSEHMKSSSNVDTIKLNIHVAKNGNISTLQRADEHHRIDRTDGSLPAYDLAGRHVWTRLTDIHTHLDKTQSWERSPNNDGTFEGAKDAAKVDRISGWTADDVYRRMSFGLRCALAHGTRSIRTHLDSQPGRTAPTWEVFAQLRSEYTGRLNIQGVATLGIEKLMDAYGEEVASLAKRYGGILGPVVYNTPDALDHIKRAFQLAEMFSLDLDFHVDETLDRESNGLSLILDEVERRHFSGRVVCGHCCSLSLKGHSEVSRICDRAAEFDVGVITLPMTNTYLLGRDKFSTPLQRGLTAVKQLRAAGASVAFASDNCRDPFNPYGDYDMVEVFRESARLAHADLPWGDWASAISTVPERLMKLKSPARIEVGATADFIIFEGRSFSEVFARLGSARKIITNGVEAFSQTDQLPSFDELYDNFMPT